MRTSCPLLIKERTLPNPESVRSFCLYGYQSSHLRIICHMYQNIFFFLFLSFFESWFKIRLSRRLVYGGTSKVLSAEPWKLHNHSSDTFFWTRAGRTVRRDHLSRKGYEARKPARAEAKVLSEKCCLRCRVATGKATKVQTGQWYFSTELAEYPAEVRTLWYR